MGYDEKPDRDVSRRYVETRCHPWRPWARRRAARASAVLVIAITLGLAAPATARAEAAASDWVRTEQTAVRLVSATRATGDAASVVAGLHFRLEDGWKIYWRSPGDAGFPPHLDWTASGNLAFARLAWPAPQRFSILGFESMGYKDEVVLPITATLGERGRPAAPQGEPQVPHLQGHLHPLRDHAFPRHRRRSAGAQRLRPSHQPLRRPRAGRRRRPGPGHRERPGLGRRSEPGAARRGDGHRGLLGARPFRRGAAGTGLRESGCDDARRRPARRPRGRGGGRRGVAGAASGKPARLHPWSTANAAPNAP